MPRLTIAAAITVTVALATWGVAATIESNGPAEPEVHARIDGPVLSSDHHSERGMLALITGRLRLADGCLFLGQSDSPVIWPNGSEWNDAQSAVQLDDGRVVRLGDLVSGGGGILSATDVSKLFDADLGKAVRNCDRDGRNAGALVFNPNEHLKVN
jgi:hypothetical protein